jgi:uncharacterized protein with PQ loop repeat
MKLNLLSNGQGYWGNPTAGIDWCEPNYTHSFYFAEFYNTISNSVYWINAILFYWQLHRFYKNTHKSKVLYRFYMFPVALGLVGIGSWLFHMTLLTPFQAMDELAMNVLIILVGWFAFSMEDYKDAVTDIRRIEQLPDGAEKTRQEAFHVVLTAFGYFYSLKSMLYAVYSVIVFGLLLRVYDAQTPLTFQLPFGIMFFTVVYWIVKRAYFFSRKYVTPETAATVRRHENVKQHLLIIGAIFAVFSLLVWNIDNETCPRYENFKLHSLWHLFTSLACWVWAQMITYTYHVDKYDAWKYESLKKKEDREEWFVDEEPIDVQLIYRWNFIPEIIQMTHKSKSN